MMNLEESGKQFADQLCTTLHNTNIHTQLDDPQEAFDSGCYFGAVQGFKRGVNVMLQEAVHCLPDIYNKIVESKFDMSVDWGKEYETLILKEVFGIEQNNR